MAMTRSNGSDNWRDQIVDYVLGNLDSNEVTALQEQIAVDPSLAEELADLQESLSGLPYVLPKKAPPSALKASIMAAAKGADQAAAGHQLPTMSHVQPEEPTSLSAAAKARRRAPWSEFAGAIAAALILALGVNNYGLQRQVNKMAQLEQTLQQNQAELERLRTQIQSMTTVFTSLKAPNSLVYALEGTGNAAGATGRLLTIPGHQEMVLVSENLPVLSEDQIYRLWAIADEAAPPEYCGQFRPNLAGAVQWLAPTETCSETPAQLLVTLDKPNDPIDSAGPLVMQSQT